MNVADSEVVASVMQMAGYEPTDNAEEADAIFLIPYYEKGEINGFSFISTVGFCIVTIR